MDYWVAAAVCLACAVVGAEIGRRKGRKTDGFMLGLIFGPIGLVAIIVLPAVTKTVCPACKEEVKPGATTCPHCRSPLTGTETAPVVQK